MYATNGTGDSVLEAILPLLWLFVVMGAVVVAIVGNKMNERMTKRIGLEMEVIKTSHAREAPHEALATWLTKKSIEWSEMKKARKGKLRKTFKNLIVRYMGYTHEVMDDVTKLVTDSSLSSGGIEIVSPVLVNEETDEWIDQVAHGLKGVAKVDNSTGLHLHVGLRAPNNSWDSSEANFGEFDGDYSHKYYHAKATLGAVLLVVGHFQRVYNMMVAPSRRNGQWSKNVSRIWDKSFVINHFEKISERTEAQHMRMLNKVADYFINSGSRYTCVNPQAFERYGTIEFRSHQGTTNGRKIKNWVDMHYLLVQRCTNFGVLDVVNYNRESITDFFGFLGVSPNDPLFKHQVRRIRKLNATNLNKVFQHDPQLALGQLFKKSETCSGCGSQTCDHDDECGVKPTTDEVNEIAHHFRGQAPFQRAWTCVECRESTVDYAMSQGYAVFNANGRRCTTWCEICDDDTTFNASNPDSLFSMYGGFLVSLIMGVSPMLLLTVGCGIGAIHVARRKFSERNLATKLLKGLQVRGAQATGFAFNRLGNVFYLKMALPASVVANKIRKEITPKETSWFMGHTRFATHGANTDKNAHPHFSRKVLITLVHNGVVHNHDDVWKALGQKPTGEVDSQAVAQCLEEGGIETVVKHCKGSMSLIWNDKRDGVDTLKCWTNGGNPLVMGRLDNAKTGAVVIASTEAILKKACGNRLKTHWDATIGREYTINADGTITKRDIEGSEETAGITYDWRTYTYLPKKKVKKSKGKVKQTKYGRGRPPYWIIKKAKEELEFGVGFDSRAGYDGYDAQKHQGVRPNGEKYNLPQYCNPCAFEDDVVEILRGDYYKVDTEHSWLDDYRGDYRFYN